MSNCSIWPIDGTLSSATTPSQSEPGSDGNEGVLHILQSSSTTGASPLDGFASYPGNSLGGFYSLCRDAVSVFYSPSRLGCITLSGPECNGRGVLPEPHHLMHFSDIFRIPFLWQCRVLPLCKGYSQHIISPIGQSVNIEKYLYF